MVGCPQQQSLDDCRQVAVLTSVWGLAHASIQGQGLMSGAERRVSKDWTICTKAFSSVDGQASFLSISYSRETESCWALPRQNHTFLLGIICRAQMRQCCPVTTCRAVSQSCSQSNILGTLRSLNRRPLPAFGILWGKRSNSQESLGWCRSHDPVCPQRSVRSMETRVTLKSQWHFRLMGLHMRIRWLATSGIWVAQQKFTEWMNI